MKIVRKIVELILLLKNCVIENVTNHFGFLSIDVSLATDFASKGVIKPLCLVWIYNFIYDQNSADNDRIWNEYLYSHPTIVCNQVAKILFKRREIEKLRQFLNLEKLQKKRILSTELGKAYSFLFDGLLHEGGNDTLIDELQKALLFLSVIDLRPKTLSKIKLSSPELSERFWSVINNSYPQSN